MAEKSSRPQAGPRKTGPKIVSSRSSTNDAEGGEVEQLRADQFHVEQLLNEQMQPARPAEPPQRRAEPIGGHQPKSTLVIPAPLAAPANEQKPRSADPGRRVAKRRPAGPARTSIAANDDVPSIGALIYALNQKPSKRPFHVAAVASVIWTIVAGIAGWFLLSAEAKSLDTVSDLLSRPAVLMVLSSILVPIAICWFLAMLIWRAQELKLMSSAMTEVAVRLAEPDRMAEQAVASLGQNVRRQVAFMNDAVGRALGRAGELEAMVHSEVSALERSYSENESRIRSLIDELASERTAIQNNSERVSHSLKGLGSQVAKEIGAVSDQAALRMQQTSQQLTNSLQQATDRSSELLSERGNAFLAQLTNIYARLSQDVPQLITKLGDEQSRLTNIIERAGDNLVQLESSLATHTGQLDKSLGERSAELQTVFASHTKTFDESMQAGVRAIDQSISERATALAIAIDNHARSLGQSMSKQAGEIDETLMQGINSVRRTSENITRQSIKSIEGLASQADMLRKVSENLLSQIHSVTNRFDGQSHQIVQAASALESANLKIDNMLSARQMDLDRMLENMSQKAASFDQVMQSYSQNLAGTLNEAEVRARGVTDEFARGASRALEGSISMAEERARGLSQQIAQGTHQALEGSLSAAERRARDLGQQIVRGTSEALQGSFGEAEARARELSQQFARGYASSIQGSFGDAEERARQLTSQMAQASQQHQRDTLAEYERLKAEADAKAQRTLDELRGKFASVESNFAEQMSGFTDKFNQTTSAVQAKAAEAAREIESTQLEIRKQAEALPIATRESADAMRKALQDQLKALENLNAMANRQAVQRDVTPPLPAAKAPPQPMPQPDPARAQQPAQPRMLASVTQSLSREMQQRQRGGQPVPPQLPQQQADGRWSVGDLLARASGTEGGSNPATFASLAQGIEPQVAQHVWSLIRTGQRGVLGPQIYTANGRALFEAVSRQCQSDMGFRANAQRMIADFERTLGEAAAAGGNVDQLIASDAARAYIMLAHATGHLT